MDMESALDHSPGSSVNIKRLAKDITSIVHLVAKTTRHAGPMTETGLGEDRSAIDVRGWVDHVALHKEHQFKSLHPQLRIQPTTYNLPSCI